MHAKALRCLVAALVLAGPGGVRAAAAASGDCRTPEGDVLRERGRMVAEHERLPRQWLESLVRRCQAAAEATLLGLDEAAVCSVGYEALLRGGFGGDFRALLAWWKSERGQR